ncbi:MAG: hypothetical protein JWQ02_1507 [Capsulimonas sp.]|jgi:hypothetical protein|nr:hypothetical protein [Capsulimonas sp.]
MWVKTKKHLLNLAMVERISLFRTTVSFWGPTSARTSEHGGENEAEIGVMEFPTSEEAEREYERLTEMLIHP